MSNLNIFIMKTYSIFITILFFFIIGYSYHRILSSNRVIEEQNNLLIQGKEALLLYQQNNDYKDTIITLLKELNSNLNQELEEIKSK